MSGLETKLEQIDYDTLEGDTALATVTNIKEHRKRIKISVELPSGRSHSETFDIPETNSQSYEFVRLVESMGYGLATATHIEGSKIEVEFDEYGPSIVIPDKKLSLKDIPEKIVEGLPTHHMTTIAIPFIFLGWPILGLKFFPLYFEKEFHGDIHMGDWMFGYVMLGHLMCGMSWFFVLGFMEILF